MNQSAPRRRLTKQHYCKSHNYPCQVSLKIHQRMFAVTTHWLPWQWHFWKNLSVCFAQSTNQTLLSAWLIENPNTQMFISVFRFAVKSVLHLCRWTECVTAGWRMKEGDSCLMSFSSPVSHSGFIPLMTCWLSSRNHFIITIILLWGKREHDGLLKWNNTSPTMLLLDTLGLQCYSTPRLLETFVIPLLCGCCEKQAEPFYDKVNEYSTLVITVQPEATGQHPGVNIQSVHRDSVLTMDK